MNAGKMNRRITVQNRPSGQDSFGQPLSTGWTDLGSLWANVEPLTGDERFAAAAVSAEITTRVRTRYWAGIIAGARIVLDDGLVLDIEAVLPDRKHTSLEILCKQAD